MSLRLVDAHLTEQSSYDGMKIIGWYTANSNAGDDELPNTSAIKIATSIAAETNRDNFILLLASTSALVECIEASSNKPLCTVFENDKTRVFTQKVDTSRVQIMENGNNLGVILKKAVSSVQDGDVAGGGRAGSVKIFDFVDHLESCGNADWIENGSVNKLVEKS